MLQLMELVLVRTYFSGGTNGILLHDGLALCHTIELPWQDNRPGISCIPEGRYALVKRYSQKFGWHLQVANVAGRDLILIHPANDALHELHGCIAPVTTITGEGKGSASRVVCEKLKAFVFPVIERGERVELVVEKDDR
jgi:hypothetical protein